MTGISRLRAWLSAKVRAGMGILVRQDNICMAMAERSENGRAELVWQEEYVRGNDEGVEDFWARAALGTQELPGGRGVLSGAGRAGGVLL